MNSFIDILNLRGGNFWSFAWPMFWQSSLLIVVLFVFDYLFRRKIRASIRYALWLVVLVKLCVPPTLALPTSPAWWLHQTPPPVVFKPEAHYTVTYDNAPLPQIPLPTFTPPQPAMLPAAWLLFVSSVISSALLAWLLARWWQVTRQVRRAKLSGRLAVLAEEAQKHTGMKFNLRVKLTTNSMSPAVCGLFRPVILIPQTLAENFSDEQLRSVLLHELIHLRRRDVWVNFFQALLQIIYWWHPLVWLANARIRRVREEAVDDAVMLALRDEAEAYAPTLLAVAKLALNRPLASLGLVGILESRHALRQRIERLVDFRPPRRAGLTLFSLLGVLAFTAVAVPMGRAPNSSDESDLHATPVSTTSLSWTPTNAPVVLVQAEIYRMRQTDFEKLVSDPAFAGTRQNKVENFKQFERLLESSGFHPISRPRIQTASGLPAEFDVGNETNSIELECRPVVTNGLIDLASRITIISTMEDMTTTNQWTNSAALENGGGHVFSIKPPDDSSGTNIVVVTMGAEIVTNQSPFHERFQVIIKREPPDIAKSKSDADKLVQDAKLDYEMGHLDEAVFKLKEALALDFTNSGAKYYLGLVRQKVQKLNGYSTNESDADQEAFVRQISGFGIEEPPMAPATNLISRHYRVDARVFSATLRNTPGLQTNDVSTMAKSLFSQLGVNLDVPGKAVFYNDGLSELFVRATPQDMDTIEVAIEALSQPPPQIHIKARFLEVPKPFHLESLMMSLNANTREFKSVLNQSNVQMVLKELETQKGSESLGEPEVVTTSGRQTEMRATEIHEVLIASNAKNPSNDSLILQTNQIETGPVLDVIPIVLSDGYTISLVLKPSLTELLISSNSVPNVLPGFRVRQMTTTLNLWDNQTAVLGGLPERDYINGKEVADKSKSSDKELLVLITATLVDPAGNRIHSDDEMPFAQIGIPPQPQPAK